MKISSKLPQFDNERSLIIVTGIFDALFYLATNGEINKIAGFEFDKVKYENEKDTYLKTGAPLSVRGGLSYDNDYQKIAGQEFAENFQDAVGKTLKNEKIDAIYILAADKIINRIPEMLPVDLRKKIKFRKEGNYLKAHPFEIIEIVKAS